jgi:glycine/serine hydroxymethyltransferase
MEKFKQRMKELSSRIIKNNIRRQRESFNLIPSETTPSLIVKVCEISDPAGRYAEHRTMKGEEIYFYQGIDFIREIELELKDEMSRFFSVPKVEVRPISGQMANEVVFKAIVKYLNTGRENSADFRRMGSVMNNKLTLGGHLSAQPMGALFNFVDIDPATGKERVINFPVRREDPYQIDPDEMIALIKKEKPDLLIFGKSMFIKPEPVREAFEAVRSLETRPFIMFDMAHVLGLYGAFQSPFEDGADLVTGSTHKTFFGPQRGIVAGNLDIETPRGKLWNGVVNRAFPGSTSNHHLGTLLALLVATCEMNTFKDEYQRKVIGNARAFAKAIADTGIPVEGNPATGFTDTHQVLFRIKEYGDGMEVARNLEENNVITNYQALPDDESFLDPSGIRTGVQEMTRFGMEEEDFGRLAEIIAEIIVRGKDMLPEVKRFRERFLEMKYSLSARDGSELAAEILASIFPSSEYAEKFAENLREVSRNTNL